MPRRQVGAPIPEPIAPIRTEPVIPRGQIAPAVEQAVKSALKGYVTPEAALHIIDEIEIAGRRDEDVTLLYYMLVRRGPQFTSEGAREVRLYLNKVTGLEME